MKYGFIAAQRTYYPIVLLCRTLGVSKSGFYAHLNRKPSTREQQSRQLTLQVKDVYLQNESVYGSPRIHHVLQEEGHACSENLVAKLMRCEGLHAIQCKRFRVSTTDSEHDLPIADNLLNRQFSPVAPNQAWAGDITYLSTAEGWLYLAVVIDLFSRRVVGHSMSRFIDQALVSDALRSAIGLRRPPSGLLHHTDRGSQYASNAYQDLLREHGMQCSMSRKGNCWDNAVVESFFHTLKTERVYHKEYKTRAQARIDVFDYIERFYNRRRRHSSLKYLNPAEYEERYLAGVA
jgi:transposase InsO family protein